MKHTIDLQHRTQRNLGIKHWVESNRWLRNEQPSDRRQALRLWWLVVAAVTGLLVWLTLVEAGVAQVVMPVPEQQPQIRHAHWLLQAGNVYDLTDLGFVVSTTPVGSYNITQLPPLRYLSRVTVVQLTTTSGDHLLGALEQQPPCRGNSLDCGYVMPMIELSDSKWFPLNGWGWMVERDGGGYELKVTLGEVK